MTAFALRTDAINRRKVGLLWPISQITNEEEPLYKRLFFICYDFIK